MIRVELGQVESRIAEQTTEPEIRGAIFHALRRWQEQAENPLLNHDQRYAARIVVRTCEGMLAHLPAMLAQQHQG